MMGNEIITTNDSRIQGILGLIERVQQKLERYCRNARPTLGDEVYLTSEELCERLRINPRALQEYRDNGTLPFYKLGGKMLYKASDIQRVLEQHYNPVWRMKR